MFLALKNYINTLEFNDLSAERKKILDVLVKYINEKKVAGKVIRLNFVCTHNSRRSHLSQIWAQTMAYHFKVDAVQCYSSGTEATALYPRVLQTLKNTGFQIESLSEGSNPIYCIKYSSNEPSIIGFSKSLDAPFNPSDGFAAIMTCGQADKDCPFVPGAEVRIPITYEDPKAFDNTSEQTLKYAERSRQIACEMGYVFSKSLNH